MEEIQVEEEGQLLDRQLLGFHPLHNCRMIFYNLKPHKDKSHIRFFTRFMDAARIAEIGGITTEAMILHIYCQATPHSDISKPIKKGNP